MSGESSTARPGITHSRSCKTRADTIRPPPLPGMFEVPDSGSLQNREPLKPIRQGGGGDPPVKGRPAERRPQARQGPRLARTSPALDLPLHPDLGLMAQRRRTRSAHCCAMSSPGLPGAASVPDSKLRQASQCLARRRVVRRMWEMSIQASAEATDFSQSLASLRQRPSQAKVRSTTHRRGSTSKPFAVSDRFTTSIVHAPTGASAPRSSAPHSRRRRRRAGATGRTCGSRQARQARRRGPEHRRHARPGRTAGRWCRRRRDACAR